MIQPGLYETDRELFEATRQDGRPRLLVQRPSAVGVVLGRGSRAEVELHLDACERDAVAVQRRSGGGCAVVLDPGQVIVSFSLPAPGFGENLRWFARISEQLIAALAGLGLSGLRQAGISDLAVGDRKVAGACLHRSRDTLLYAASLLVEPRVDLMERYLQHPPREPDYRKGRSHGQFVRGLAELQTGLDAEKVMVGLRERLAPDAFEA